MNSFLKAEAKVWLPRWQKKPSRTDKSFQSQIKNIDKGIAEILSVKQYENMVIHYNLLRIFLDRDYDDSKIGLC